MIKLYFYAPVVQVSGVNTIDQATHLPGMKAKLLTFMRDYQPRSRHWRVLAQSIYGRPWRAVFALLGIILIGFGGPLACCLNCWLDDAPVAASVAPMAVSIAPDQVTVRLDDYRVNLPIHQSPATSTYHAQAQLPNQNTPDCAFCRAHETISLLVEAALLAHAPLTLSLPFILLLGANVLLFRLIAYPPPRRPPRLLTA